MPARRKDITGLRFERLLAVRDMGQGPNGYRMWEFECDCGHVGIYSGSEVWRGLRKSCGCYIYEQLKINNLKHGHRRTVPTPTYRSWQSMHTRCQKNPRYYGINICERWYSFELFLEDMGERPSVKHSLDRINNTGDYTKVNCRWATAKEQNRNSSNNVIVNWQGVQMCLKELAELVGVNYSTLHDRYRRRGWSLDEAIYGKRL